MILGVGGPSLVVLHSKLHFGSLNATVAFTSMSLVVGSGLVGRFLYRHIHHGLYGRKATLAELHAEAGIGGEAVRSALAFAPKVEARLARYARYTKELETKGARPTLSFFTLGFSAWRLRWRCSRETERLLRKRALAEGWAPEKLRRRVRHSRMLIKEYIVSVQRVTQFAAYERLFRWWHILHVPLLYMLILTAIAHVVAVHMY